MWTEWTDGAGGLARRQGPELEPQGRTPVAVLGGTGYVGRLLAARLLSHPTLCLGPVVGSKRSDGLRYKHVWQTKEQALVDNYGSQLWEPLPFPSQLDTLTVSSLDQLLASDCRLAVSCVAPDVGYVEDILTSHGFKVFSISPYKRAENLMVVEVNPQQMSASLAREARLFKSPNCVSVGTTLALKALDDAFGVADVSCCTLQSLSGRGDALYPPELVQGNVYPVWGTKEGTEKYIANEISALIPGISSLSVRAHRVGVQTGHFVDVRVRLRDSSSLGDVEDVYAAFDRFAPLRDLAGVLPSLPPRPLVTMREVGTPRPRSHNSAHGGMAVVVGNVKLHDGSWDVCFSLVVNNMVRGAYGQALLMAEYCMHLEAHPEARIGPPCHKKVGVAATDGSHSPDSPLSVNVASLGEESPGGCGVSPPIITTPTPSARTNAITSLTATRAVAAADPTTFHSDFARSRLHWFHPELCAWLRWEEASSSWCGWSLPNLEACELAGEAGRAWSPWEKALDQAAAPYYGWFSGARTSAAFNEVDRHVLAGHGDELAAVSYVAAAAADSEFEAGHAHKLTRAELLYQSVVAARALQRCGVSESDRVVLHMPSSATQLVWIEAVKRLGAIFVCLPTTLSIKALADRLADCGAKLVLSTSTPSPTLSGVKLKAVALRAVSDYVKPSVAVAAVREELPRLRELLGQELAAEEVAAALEASFGAELTVAAREIGLRLQTVFSLRSGLREQAGMLAARLQEAAVRSHLSTSRPAIMVVSRGDLAPSGSWLERNTSDSRLGSAEGLSALAAKSSSTAASAAAPFIDGHAVWDASEADLLDAAEAASAQQLLSMPPAELTRRLWRLVAPTLLQSHQPLMIMYTSGTSGFKPRGLVYDHAGFVSGAVLTMETCFDVREGSDVILVHATPAWITGQTYAITGALSSRATTVIAPPELTPRVLSAIVSSSSVSIFVASASFLKRALPSADDTSFLRGQQLSKSLRIACSCGEPLSAHAHALGMETLTPQYVNTYWATEHGSIVLSHAYGNLSQPLRSDSRMQPLPWAGVEVWVPESNGRFHPAAENGSEKGLLVCTKPWPSMARTAWGCADELGAPGWRGDVAAFTDAYYSSFVHADGTRALALSLGDLAQRWEDGSISVIGRSREVLRVAGSGEDICAVDLENTLLRHPAVLDCLVVAVDAETATEYASPTPAAREMAPVACLVLREAEELDEIVLGALKMLVHENHGEHCVPIDLVRITAFPRTYSSKPMRQVVTQLFAGSFHGDVSEISNPSCLTELESTIEAWRATRELPVLDERV